MAEIQNPYFSDHTGPEIDESVRTAKGVQQRIAEAVAPKADKTALTAEEARAKAAEQSLESTKASKTELEAESARAQEAEQANADNIATLGLKVEDLNNYVGVTDEIAEYSVKVAGSVIGTNGQPQSVSGWNIVSVQVKKGDVITLEQAVSQYVVPIAKLNGSTYVALVSGGGGFFKYESTFDGLVYLSLSNGTIRIKSSSLATKVNELSSNTESLKELIDVDFKKINGKKIAENSYIAENGTIQSGNFTIYEINVRKGDVIKSVGITYSRFFGVFAKRYKNTFVLLVKGDGGSEYTYVADDDCSIIYQEESYIKESKVLNTVYVGNKLDGKKILFLGDSITEFTFNDMGYPDWISLKTNAIVTKGGIGGSRISAKTRMADTPTSVQEAYSALAVVNIVEAIVNNNWARQDSAVNYLKGQGIDKSAIIARLKTVNLKDFDYISIFAGTNDWYEGFSFGVNSASSEDSALRVNSAITKIVTLLSQNSPSTKLIAFTPIVRYAGDRTLDQWSDTYKSRGCTLADFSRKIMQFWNINHVPCCDLYYGLGWNITNFPNFFTNTDNVHPFFGFEQIADKFIGFINSGAINEVPLTPIEDALALSHGLTSFGFVVTSIVSENKFIDNSGNESANVSYDIRSYSAKKGDVLILNQGSNQYISVFATKNGAIYTPIVIGSGMKRYYYKVEADTVIYFSHSKDYDTLFVAHYDL